MELSLSQLFVMKGSAASSEADRERVVTGQCKRALQCLTSDAQNLTMLCIPAFSPMERHLRENNISLVYAHILKMLRLVMTATVMGMSTRSLTLFHDPTAHVNYFAVQATEMPPRLWEPFEKLLHTINTTRVEEVPGHHGLLIPYQDSYRVLKSSTTLLASVRRDNVFCALVSLMVYGTRAAPHNMTQRLSCCEAVLQAFRTLRKSGITATVDPYLKAVTYRLVDHLADWNPSRFTMTGLPQTPKYARVNESTGAFVSRAFAPGVKKTEAEWDVLSVHPQRESLFAVATDVVAGCCRFNPRSHMQSMTSVATMDWHLDLTSPFHVVILKMLQAHGRRLRSTQVDVYAAFRDLVNTAFPDIAAGYSMPQNWRGTLAYTYDSVSRTIVSVDTPQTRLAVMATFISRNMSSRDIFVAVTNLAANTTFNETDGVVTFEDIVMSVMPPPIAWVLLDTTWRPRMDGKTKKTTGYGGHPEVSLQTYLVPYVTPAVLMNYTSMISHTASHGKAPTGKRMMATLIFYFNALLQTHVPTLLDEIAAHGLAVAWVAAVHSPNWPRRDAIEKVIRAVPGMPRAVSVDDVELLVQTFLVLRDTFPKLIVTPREALSDRRTHRRLPLPLEFMAIWELCKFIPPVLETFQGSPPRRYIDADAVSRAQSLAWFTNQPFRISVAPCDPPVCRVPIVEWSTTREKAVVVVRSWVAQIAATSMAKLAPLVTTNLHFGVTDIQSATTTEWSTTPTPKAPTFTATFPVVAAFSASLFTHDKQAFVLRWAGAMTRMLPYTDVAVSSDLPRWSHPRTPTRFSALVYLVDMCGGLNALHSHSVSAHGRATSLLWLIANWCRMTGTVCLSSGATVPATSASVMGETCDWRIQVLDTLSKETDTARRADLALGALKIPPGLCDVVRKSSLSTSIPGLPPAPALSCDGGAHAPDCDPDGGEVFQLDSESDVDAIRTVTGKGTTRPGNGFLTTAATTARTRIVKTVTGTAEVQNPEAVARLLQGTSRHLIQRTMSTTAKELTAPMTNEEVEVNDFVAEFVTGKAVGRSQATAFTPDGVKVSVAKSTTPDDVVGEPGFSSRHIPDGVDGVHVTHKMKTVAVEILRWLEFQAYEPEASPTYASLSWPVDVTAVMQHQYGAFSSPDGHGSVTPTACVPVSRLPVLDSRYSGEHPIVRAPYPFFAPTTQFLDTVFRHAVAVDVWARIASSSPRRP